MRFYKNNLHQTLATERSISQHDLACS